MKQSIHVHEHAHIHDWKTSTMTAVRECTFLNHVVMTLRFLISTTMTITKTMATKTPHDTTADIKGSSLLRVGDISLGCVRLTAISTE